MKNKILLSLLTGLTLSTFAQAGETESKTIVAAPPEKDSWEYLLSMPGWLAGVNGDVGINGVISHVDVSPIDVIRRIDMTVSLSGEVRHGRFGAQGDFLYLDLSDGVGTDGMLKKVDIRLDQIMADFGVSYRFVEGKRGWVDAIAGVRYTNIYQRLTLYPSETGIQSASTQLVDAASTLAGDALKEAVSNIIAEKLAALGGQDPTLPEGPIGENLPGNISDKVQAIIDAKLANLTAAIQSGVQSRIDAAKADLSSQLAKALHESLDTSLARTDDWLDPYVGLRARYNINQQFYLTAKGDIGGFGVGSDLTWQVSAAIGYQLSPNLFTEIGYRYLAVDYQGGGLTYDVATQGAQITMGIKF